MDIIIYVIDMNDNKPEFTQNSFHGKVPDAAPKDYEFMTVTATDADDPNTKNAEVRYSIISQDPPSPNPNMFAIKPVTGVIRVNSEGLNRKKWSKYTLVLQAANMRGDGYPMTGRAVIIVTDSNDNPPQFEQETYTVSVLENLVGVEVAKLTVTDDDEPGSPAWSTKYKIISGDEGGVFSISTGPSQLEGIITTVKPLDYEKTKQYILSVIVENDHPFVGPLPTSTATVTVNVEDVNDNAPYINEREIKICNQEAPPVLLSITDKYLHPNAGPFSVETQGDTRKYWTARMNDSGTGIELILNTMLMPGVYNVVLRVFNKQKLYQDSLKATVCNCKGESVVCSEIWVAGLSLSGVFRIICTIFGLLSISYLLVLFMRRQICLGQGGV
ncbi:cadherin-2-like [Paramisgurnus dabryanus]|uniref:cadherin-2-like n=1 Tax=Paramisgurnus dabryanus TaxID=90735 RepID=UPI003CCFA12B